MPDVRMPDGTIIQNVPDGVTQADLSARYQAHLGASAAPQAATASQDSVAADIAKSGATGLVKGAAGLADSASGIAALPGVVSPELAAQKEENLANPNLTIPATLVGGSGHDIADFISKLVGGFHTPQTGAGVAAERVGEFAPGAAIPGGAIARTARVLVPAAGSLAGQAVGGDTGAAIGGILGGGVEMAGERAGAGIASAIADRNLPPQQKAEGLLSRALQRDNVPPDVASQAAARYPDKELTVMDTGGSNVARLARTVRTLPGEASNDLESFLTERQADQHNRVLGDITNNFANGADVHTLSDKLMADREVSSGPLYKEAFKANQSVSSPVIDRILETPAGKQALADARTKMQNDQTLMGVPDAELRDQALEAGQAVPKGGVASGLKLRTLDYVKRALDDQIGASIKNNTSDNTRILTGLKKSFVGALDEADATANAGLGTEAAPQDGLYKRARAAYSGPSQSLDAITSGQDFLKMDPETLAKTIKDLPASDQDFFRIGAARALQDKVSGAADNADAVPRVFGNKTIRAQIAAVFGPDATAKFAEAAGAEKMATATNRTVRGGSDTAAKLADIQDGDGHVEKAVRGFARGGVKGAVAGVADVPARLNAFFNGMSPEVRNALSELLTKTGGGTNSLSNAKSPVVDNSRVNALVPIIGSRVLSAMLNNSNANPR